MLVQLLNGVSYGLLLFMLSAGLTLIFSMMGVLNFAHASFYMLGAYLAFSLAKGVGFWPALLVAPLAIGLAGALFERYCLRRVHRFGHVPELLVTFGLSFIILEFVHLMWGRYAVEFHPPEALRGPLFTLVSAPGEALRVVWGTAPLELCNAAAGALCSPFPATRGFMALTAVFMLLALWLVFARTRVGLVIQAALDKPEMVESLGHNVPRVFMGVFGGGSALAGLAGVVGGSSFLTEPSMAVTVGSIIFVVIVVGGMGSLLGAFVASLAIGILQTTAVAFDRPLGASLGVQVDAGSAWQPLANLSLAQVAPVLPYLMLVLILIFRPRGLMGTRED